MARSSLAPFLLVLAVVLIGCTAASWRRLGASTRVEVGTGSSSGDLSRPGGRTWDSEAESQWVALSWDLLPFLAVGEHEARVARERAELVRAFREAQTPLPFVQSSPPPDLDQGGTGALGKGGNPAAASPWYLDGAIMGPLLLALAGGATVSTKKGRELGGRAAGSVKRAGGALVDRVRKRKPP